MYVDNDPIVLVHARALLADHGRTVIVDGDIRAPDRILADKDLRSHLDFSRPVAVLLTAVLHFITDAENPARIIATFREAMAPGSALVITHVVHDGDVERDTATRAAARIYSRTTAPFAPRTRCEVAQWFHGFRLLPPGLVNADAWRRNGNGKVTAPIVAGVGRLDGREREGRDRFGDAVGKATR